MPAHLGIFLPALLLEHPGDLIDRRYTGDCGLYCEPGYQSHGPWTSCFCSRSLEPCNWPVSEALWYVWALHEEFLDGKACLISANPSDVPTH
jgi:hypothetical protein